MFKVGMGRAEDSIAHLTALKLASEQRAELEGQLCQAQKLESVGRLASGVARDFDQLLAPIIERADRLLDDMGPGAPLREDVWQIRQAAERARGLAGKLFAFGGQQVLALEPMDVGALLGRIEPVLRRTARENIRLEVRPPRGRGLVRADAGQIEQALMNLAINAEDAMPGGGTLTIAADEAVIDQARAGLDPGLPLGPCVTISVTDTGVGMDAETRSRICEPFFTTKERGGRTGLGLSAVYGIVKQHGGHLAVDSAPGKGSTFTIVLPKATDAAERTPSPN
jgi:signal transduction histidine kinase